LEFRLVLGPAAGVGRLDEPVLEPQHDRLRGLVRDHGALAGEDTVPLALVAVVRDEDVAERVRRLVDLLGVDDEARELVVEDLLPDARTGAALGDLEEGGAERPVPPGARPDRQAGRDHARHDGEDDDRVISW
jgi:hypothetical protein